MKTQINYNKTDGSEGLALAAGHVSEGLPAKRELARKLGLPFVDTPDGPEEDVDERLREGGVIPESVSVQHISE